MLNVDMEIRQGQGLERADQLPITDGWESFTTAVEASFGKFELTSQFNSRHRAYNKGFDDKLKEVKSLDPENESYYNSYGNSTNAHKRIFEELYNSGKISLEDGKIKAIGGSAKHYAIEKEEAIKGYLLSMNQGLDTKEVRGKVETEVKAKYDEYEALLERTTGAGAVAGEVAGTMGGALTDHVFLATLPLGTAARGAGIVGNAMKAFGQEAAIGAGTELVIQGSNYNFKQAIGLDYGLADLAIDTLSAGVAGGVIRAGGSIAVDTNVLRKANWNKEVFDRFERITYGTKTDKQIDTLEAINKAYEDKINGETVNVDKITDDAPTTYKQDDMTDLNQSNYSNEVLQGESMFKVADNDFQKLEMPDDEVVAKVEELGYNTSIKPELEALDMEINNIEKGLAECLS